MTDQTDWSDLLPILVAIKAHVCRAGREAEEEALDLAVHHPVAVAPERGLQGGVLFFLILREASLGDDHRIMLADGGGRWMQRDKLCNPNRSRNTFVGFFRFLDRGFIEECVPFIFI